ncbi:MAG: hypothetical protein V3U76_09510 [Granulosicoccus sp.]
MNERLERADPAQHQPLKRSTTTNDSAVGSRAVKTTLVEKVAFENALHKVARNRQDAERQSHQTDVTRRTQTAIDATLQDKPSTLLAKQQSHENFPTFSQAEDEAEWKNLENNNALLQPDTNSELSLHQEITIAGSAAPKNIDGANPVNSDLAESISAVIRDLHLKTEESLDGNWLFQVVDSSTGIETVQLGRSDESGWQLRITFFNDTAGSNEQIANSLKNSLTAMGHDIGSISVESNKDNGAG